MNKRKLISILIFCSIFFIVQIFYGIDTGDTKQPAIVINNYGSNSNAQSTSITKSESNFFTNFSFKTYYENSKDFIKNNWEFIRPSLIAAGILGLYAYLISKCLDVGTLYDPKSDSWVSWKMGTTADNLVSTPTQTLYSEMVPELKRKYFYSTENNSILSYIKIFGLKIDNEINRLEWYKKLMGLGALSWAIDKTIIVKVPTIAEVEESIRKLRHMKSVVANNYTEADNNKK